ncbi:flavoprotein-like protein [Thamnidium elegans]|nr:flavoprotein-like protein [Thamnidium elegans]
MKNIGVIIGSVRTARIGHVITRWVLQSITVKHNLNLELIDLSEWNLPLLDEPEIPAKGVYVFEKTKRWSEKISSKDGFIFITPQYNWGYPASLKNAVDYLFKEWNDKPAIIVSYAYRGGGKAASQFRQVVEGLRMKPTETMPAIVLAKDMFNENGKIKDDYPEFTSLYEEVVNKAVVELEQEFNKV